ncbi:MAG: alkaline phosphatase family protein [Candidatus Paceibacterota bacterium]
MKIKKIVPFFCVGILLLSSCKKEAPSIPCDENNYEIDECKIGRKVLIIGIDGFRSDVMNATNTPFLFALSGSTDTYFTGQHKVESYTSSGPNWTSILTGVHCEKHLVEDNFFGGYDPLKFPTFFHYIEEAMPSIKTASIAHWIPLNYVIIDDQSDYNPIQLLSDLEVADRGIGMVNGSDSEESDVLFLHFDDLDHYGHAFGYHDTIPEYRQAVSTMDGYVEMLMNAVIERRNLGEDWAIFIISDHGGEGREHSNMPNVPNVIQTIFYANHPTANFKSNYISSQADLAPSVLSFLGIKNAGFDNIKDGNSLID